MIGFCPLASGSKGNAIYLGTTKTKILIDAGLSLKVLKQRLIDIDVDIASLDAVLITHEHGDHIKGLSTLCKKYGIPVFTNKETAQAILSSCRDVPRFKIFTTGEPFHYGDVLIHPFSVQHDAMDPVAFTFEFEGMKVGLCADLGFVSSLVTHHLQGCDYLYLEANHQPSMVYASPRPVVYKQRVLSRQGHLSNEEAGHLLASIHHDKLKHVYLAHLSSECNSPELALKIIGDLLQACNKPLSLSIAHQDEVSQLTRF